MKQQGSNFVTPAGIIILVVLILVAAFFHMTGLEALLAAVLLLSLISYFWSRKALSHLEIQATDSDCRGFPGHRLKMELTIKNDKFLPLVWLEARLPLPENSPIQSTEHSAESGVMKSRFLWIMPRQTLRFKQSAEALHRGVVRYESVDMRSGDGFGLSSLTKAVTPTAPFRFVVYPAIHAVNLSPIENRLRELENHRSGYYTDPTLISTIRDYQPGDSIKNISWRQLARTGTLQTNVRETMRMSRFCLIPNLKSYVYYKKENVNGVDQVQTLIYTDAMEKMLSLLASIVVQAQEQGLLCSLVIPAMGSQSARIIIPESRETQVPELLTALAEIQYSGEETFLPFFDMEDQQHLLGRSFLFSYRLKKSDPDSPLLSPTTVHVVQTNLSELPEAQNILDAKELQP